MSGDAVPEDGRRDAEALVTDLERAARAHEEARERVAEAGEQRLETLRDHYETIAGLLDRYEDRIVSDGEGEVDMEAFIEFQEEIARFVERLPDALEHRDAFEAVEDITHQRWLKQSDFAEARAALQPVAELVEYLEERERTRERYREARHAVAAREHELAERIADLEDLLALGEADLEAPVKRLRDPVAAYNDAVADAFETFKREESAREVLGFVETTATYPLVEYRPPPEDLLAYVEDSDAGEESIPTLLEYADYSVSKLEHYVSAARRLKRNVATHQTYLRRLDAAPLRIEWPPPDAGTLRWRCRELIAVVGRFAPEAVVAKLRAVRELPRETAYERLRESARARDRLDDEERERLASGAVEAELSTLRERHDTLTEALAEHPER